MAEKEKVFSFRCSTISFGNITRDRNGCASKLVDDAKPLGVWERGGEFVNLQAQLNGSLPSMKSLKELAISILTNINVV